MFWVTLRNLALTMFALCLLSGCSRETVAPGNPVAAVESLADAIRDNDLVRYSKLSLPPRLHERMVQRWNDELALAPALTDAQRKDHARYMKQMMEPGAEAKLFKSYESKLGKFQSDLNTQWPMMRGAAQIFVTGAIQANEDLTPAEREHFKTIGGAILKWLDPKIFSDKEKAREAIAVICKMARDVNLPQAEQMRQLSMMATLEKGGIALKGLKDIGLIYGVDADEALDKIDVKLVDSDASGNESTVEVNYVLLDQKIRFEIDMTRIDDRWYPTDSVQEAQQTLKQALPAAAVSAP